MSLLLQKGKGSIFSKRRVAPAPSLSKTQSESQSSAPNSFEKKLRDAKVNLKKVATPVPKRSPIIPSSSDDCPICLQPMKKPPELTTTPCCKKKFHKKCLTDCKTSVCPLCRYDHVVDDIYNKLTKTEQEYPNVKKVIKDIARKIKNYQNSEQYNFINQVITKNRKEIIKRCVKKYIKDRENIDEIIYYEITNFLY